MKKILALTLGLAITFSLVACSGDKETKTAGSVKEADASAVTATETPTIATETPAADTPAADTPAADTGDSVASGTVGDYEVSIIDAELTEDYEGNPAVIVTYEWTNNSEDEADFLFSMSAMVYQNDIECEIAILEDSTTEIDNQMLTIKPGTTITVAEAYALSDMVNPIDVEVEELISFESNPPMVSATFEF